MKWPALINSPVVDKQGKMTPQWLMYFEQLTGGLNEALSDGGIVLPSANAQTVANLPPRGIVYDSTANQPKININGVIKTIVTS